MKRGVVGLAGIAWLLSAAGVFAADPTPSNCVARHVEACVTTMKNVFSTEQQTRAYCTKAAQQSCASEGTDAK